MPHLSEELVNKYNYYARYEARHWEASSQKGVRNWGDAWELAVDRWLNRPVVQEVGSKGFWTYQELDHAADKIAGWAIETGEQYIGVNQSNSAVFLATVLGLAKAGIVGVLFNIREPVQKLSDLARRSGIRIVLGSLIPGTEATDPKEILARLWAGRIDHGHRSAVTLDDPAEIIFTSGTSGRSKPALFSHRRIIGAGIAWSLRAGLTADSYCYIPLPLYHGNGLAIGFSSCVEVGACVVVRDRFSVRAFLSDIRQHQCDATVYVGEFWRYLMGQTPQPDDADNPLRVIFGNGLPASMWEATLKRFGIQHVVEHYGATEMPASALTNWTGKPGCCGYIPPEHPDAANIVLVDDDGRSVSIGEGEAIIRVPPGKAYHGYLDTALDEEKVWRDLFELGDLWWRSGDLLRRDADGFFTFIERLGDSFRWKGENVASVEVEETILSTGMVQEAVVYGVDIPGADGKAGMASLLLKQPLIEGESLEVFLARLQEFLAPYAIPQIIRCVSHKHPTTSTLKIQKAYLSAEGFRQIDKYPHFVLHQGRYIALTQERLCTLESGHLVLGFH
jgi:acyl-CoA synthetase (AMP-forming)/AMP-acid ligase II